MMTIRSLVQLLATTTIVALAPSSVLAGPTGSVLSANLKDADGSTGQDSTRGAGVKTPHLQNSAVTTLKIADGAVTDAKISGPISGAKISTSGLNADMVDGKHASELAPAVHVHSQSDVAGLAAALAGKSNKYGKVAVVAMEIGRASCRERV
jgi:hypothetical protein